MSKNNIITLRSSQGLIRRVMVRDLGEVVLVCREEEIIAAKKEHREPILVGFKKEDVIKENN